jgi:hypothetical protein
MLLGWGLGLYLLMDLWIMARVVSRSRRLADGLLLFVIPLMHLSYGFGEWFEFFRPGTDFSLKSGSERLDVKHSDHCCPFHCL